MIGVLVDRKIVFYRFTSAVVKVSLCYWKKIHYYMSENCFNNMVMLFILRLILKISFNVLFEWRIYF